MSIFEKPLRKLIILFSEQGLNSGFFFFLNYTQGNILNNEAKENIEQLLIKSFWCTE